MAAITFDFGANLAPLKRDLNEAQAIARNAANNINRTTGRGGVADLFRRTPERRAERAFGALGASLATGDVATGLMAFGERLTGLGLAAGIGIGAAIGFIQSLSKEIKEADDATAKLHEELGKPIDVLGGLGAGEISKQIEALQKAGDENAEHTKGFMHGARKFFAGPLLGSAAEMDKGEQKDAADFAKRQADLSKLRADAEQKAANIKLQAVTSSEREATLAKIATEAEEKRAKLRLERKDDPNLAKSLAAVTTEEKAARLEVEKKYKSKADELALEQKIQALKTSGKTPAQQHAEELRLRAGALQNQIAGALKEDKPALQNKLTGLQKDIDNIPWDQKTTDEKVKSILAGQKKNQEDFSIDAWRKRQTDATNQFNQNFRDNTRINDALFRGVDTDQFGNALSPVPRPAPSTAGKSEIGIGMDGIKKGIDLMNDKMDRYFA